MARGIQNHAGGAYDAAAQQDILDCDPSLGPITQLVGSADVISPVKPGNYIVSTAGVDAMTLAAPRVGTDDNLEIFVASDTTNAHTIITPTAIIAAGVAGGLKTTLTFAAQRGANVWLRAFNGTWQLVGAQGVTPS